MKKKRKNLHLMYITGLLIAAAAFGLVIFTSIMSGSKIMSSQNQRNTESALPTDSLQVNVTEENGKTSGGVEKETTKATSNVTSQGTTKVTASSTTKENGGENEPMECINYEDVKAMWLSQFDLNSVYTSSGSQRPLKSFESLMQVILDNVKNNGINTIFVQMRPYADSMYPSEYYPPSSYTVGAYGKNFNYDPIDIIIRMAHERGLSVHAWINPMRGMLESDIKKIDTKYKIRQWYDSSETNGKYLVVVDKRLYLNPAYEEVRQLIVDGAREIVRKYPVDGVHMDDYFYPTQAASFDSSAYAEYTKSNKSVSLSSFRKNNLNLLVAALYAGVKAENSNALFGISPAGVIATVTEKQYADVYTWCANKGYIDYICPQVYFGLEHQTCDFKKICKVWSDIIKTDDVKLIIGMTLGKAKSKVDNYAGSGKNEWAQSNDILKRCLEHTKTLDKCVGVSYFCYQYFYSPTTGVTVSETLNERNNFIPVLKDITWK